MGYFEAAFKTTRILFFIIQGIGDGGGVNQNPKKWENQKPKWVN